MNFSFIHDETAKCMLQRITVKSSEVSWPPPLSKSSTGLSLSVSLLTKITCDITANLRQMRMWFISF